MNGSKILAIEYYLPKKIENNKALKKFNPKLDIKRIKEKTGIDNRFISTEKESIIDISVSCSKKIFKKFPKKKIDFLILVTQTSPYRIPTTACILQNKLENSNGIYFADFKGLNVAKVNELRRNFRSQGVEYKVFKNNLTKIAAKNAGYKGLDDMLIGQIGIAYANEDPAAPAKVIKEFTKLNDCLEVIGLYFEGEIYNPDKYKEFAELPSKEELLTKLVCGLNSPMTKIAYCLQASMVKIANVLNSLKEQKNK